MVPSLFDKNCCIVEVLVFARDEIEVSLAPSLLVTFLHPWGGGFQGPKVTKKSADLAHYFSGGAQIHHKKRKIICLNFKCPSLKWPIRGPLLFRGPLTARRAPVSQRGPDDQRAPDVQRVSDYQRPLTVGRVPDSQRAPDSWKGP